MDDKYTALWLESHGKEAAPMIVALLRDCHLADSCYAYKLRTKPQDKILEKPIRKQKANPKYQIADITDIVGLRLVALFRHDMVALFEGVLKAISHSNGVSPNPLQQGIPEEIIIYKGHAAFDDLVPAIKEITQAHFRDIAIVEKNSREGYSSIHLVTRLAMKKSVSDDCPLGKEYRLPIEIQVRTVFEDAWGEIDHKYGYVIRTGKETGQPIKNPEHVLSHLKVLKKFSDACVDYAEAIREEAVGTTLVPVRSTNVISVEPDEDILKQFAAAGVAQERIAAYEHARSVKDEAGKLREEDREKGNRLLLAAAEEFRELGDSVVEPDSDPEKTRQKTRLDAGDHLFFYYTRMNEAICLMGTSDRHHVSAANNIYKNIEPFYPDFPLLKMRYGQALGKMGYFDQAIVLLRKSGEIADLILKKNFIGGIQHWPTNLPKIDYDHLALTQPKLVGYYLWLKILSLGDGHDGEKATLFLDAYQETLKCFPVCADIPEAVSSIRNNLLYYAIGYLSHVKRTEGNSSTIGAMLKDTETHIRFFEKENRIEPSLNKLDTLMKAYAYTGKKAKAKEMAERVKAICLQGGERADQSAEDQLQMVRIAEKILVSGSLEAID